MHNHIKIKVILYNPRSAASGHRLPLSILQVGASIHGKFEYVFVDGNLEKDPAEKISRYLDTGQYTVFASTVMPGPQAMEAIPLTKRIKANYPGVITVWGGYFSSMFYKVVMESGFVDYVIHGIGDYAFPKLLRVLDMRSYTTMNDATFYNLLLQIHNLVFVHDGQIIRNVTASQIHYEGLNPLPYEYLNTFYPLGRYMVKTFLGTRTASYHSGMGCPFSCSFCAIVPMFNSVLSVEEPEGVYRNIRYLKEKFGVNAIEFNDNEFFCSEQRVLKIAQMLKGENISWWAYGRIDILYRYREDTLRLLSESGCKMIFFGAETGDSDLLRTLKKGGNASVETGIKLLEKLKKYDIIPEYSFVVGFPAENPALVALQINRDLRFIKRIKKRYPRTEIILNFYRPVASDSSATYKMVQQYGYKFPGTLEEWLDPDRLIHTFPAVKYFTWFPPKSARQVIDFVTVFHAYYPSVSDFQITRFQKLIMKMVSFWRYHLDFYANPFEIRFLQKYWLKYKRPEEEGFYSSKTTLV